MEWYPFSRLNKRLRDASVFNSTNDPVLKRIRSNILTILPARDESEILPWIKNLGDCFRTFSCQLFISLIILASVFFRNDYFRFYYYTFYFYEAIRTDDKIREYLFVGCDCPINMCSSLLVFGRDLCIKKWLQFVFNECHDRAEFTRGIDNREAFEAFFNTGRLS